MKSINQIFNTNTSLMDEPEVMELMDYCRDLESQVMDNTQDNTWDKETELGELVRDIYNGCVDDIKLDAEADRWSNFSHVNFKESIINLKKYIQNFARDNNFRL